MKGGRDEKMKSIENIFHVFLLEKKTRTQMTTSISREAQKNRGWDFSREGGDTLQRKRHKTAS